ncbi:MAG: sigma-54-dependent Fis family transcriptional regulator [Myxococcales bacterium]|nr:sigma-54-dependent Fis family transcriptional regulator [Myxococcales bacterium]
MTVKAAPRFTLRPTSIGKIVGHAQTLRDVLSTIDRVANSTCTVLVTGESGTGKELIVAALHDASPRKDGPLVTVNCGAIPENLLESELFGHARGAFTGADRARAGRFAVAEGGTLFLDEVGELPLSLQVKLLRVLQQREYTPLGEERPKKCDVRIVAATNRNLEAEVLAGRFREDLYYRLNVIHIELPPLRERRDDIPVLAQHFLRQSALRSGRVVEGFTEEATEYLQSHEWKGNIRALENAVERGVLLAKGPLVQLEDVAPSRDSSSQMRAFAIPPPPPPSTSSMAPAPESERPAALPDGGIDLRAAVATYENELIRRALERTGGNRNQAARLLGLKRTTLVEILRRRAI